MDVEKLYIYKTAVLSKLMKMLSVSGLLESLIFYSFKYL